MGIFPQKLCLTVRNFCNSKKKKVKIINKKSYLRTLRQRQFNNSYRILEEKDLSLYNFHLT